MIRVSRSEYFERSVSFEVASIHNIVATADCLFPLAILSSVVSLLKVWFVAVVALLAQHSQLH